MLSSIFFFFNDTATTEIYTLSLHDALPILIPSKPLQLEIATPVSSGKPGAAPSLGQFFDRHGFSLVAGRAALVPRSEEHTSELQSRLHLVCRLLLEKKKKKSTHREGRRKQD